MASNNRELSVDTIKDAYRFIQNSNFYKIYNEFGWICNHDNYLDNGDSCYNVLSNGLSGSDVVTNLLKELYSNLYRIYYTIEDKKNDYFDGNRDIVKKMGCIYLKYWLYDQITSKGFNGLQIINLFEEFNKHVQGKIQGISKDYCKFNQLSLDQIKKIKKVYALNSILHESDKNPETCVNNHCKYMDYFEEALTEFINSIKKCADNPLEKEYCDEFEDFLKICTGGNSYTGVSIYNRHIGTSDDSNRKYLLSVKNYKNQPLYIYIKDNKWLNWGEISHIVNPQNTATIAATSVVGSAIGLSSIFYYFYKFTPFGGSLHRGKRKNIVNIDEEVHNSLLYTSDTEQMPFKNREYKVAYHTFSDT